MTINNDEYKSPIGLRDLYVADVTDSASAYTPGTPEYLAPAASATLRPVASMEAQYADDQPWDVHSSEAETDIELTVTAVPPILLAKLIGSKFDATTGRVYDRAATPPWMALGYRRKKNNGKYIYGWFLKVKFIPADESHATLEAKATPQPAKLICKAIKTQYQFDLGDGVTDGAKRVWLDEDTDSAAATGWFTQVQIPGAVAPSALALSSSDPLDNATAVAIDKTILLTFNNALPAGEINHVVLSKADGTLVACTNSLNATKKIMTVNPDANLSAATVHILAIGVTDIYGQNLQTVVNFTTA